MKESKFMKFRDRMLTPNKSHRNDSVTGFLKIINTSRSSIKSNRAKRRYRNNYNPKRFQTQELDQHMEL